LQLIHFIAIEKKDVAHRGDAADKDGCLAETFCHRVLASKVYVVPESRNWIVWNPTSGGLLRQEDTMRQENATPAPIAIDRISYLETEKGIDPTIARIDLEPVKAKLQDIDDGVGWTAEQCDEAEVMYKRFLQLNKKFPNFILVPTRIIDNVWHQHILDTRAYHKDSEKIFGAYFHHNPSLGPRNGLDEQDTLRPCEETRN